MTTRTAKFYRKHLGRYFDMHYGEYENTVMWSVDPTLKQWRFHIPELNKVVTLTCDDFGVVTEQHTNVG